MFGYRRGIVLAGLALAVLFGAAGQGPVTDPGATPHTGRTGSVVLVDATPVDAVVAVVRPRTSPTGDDGVETRWTAFAGLGLAAVAAGLATPALASWWLSRRDRLGGVLRGLRSSVATRAPPAPALG
jgi:hypothetical protein